MSAFLPILTGAASLGSGIANAFTGRKAAKYAADTAYKTAVDSTNLQNQANRDLAAYQNEYNLSMWNRENEYNTPAAQMERLKKAGLNPALMYSQGTVGNAGSPAPAASTNPDYSRFQSRANRPAFTLPDVGNAISQVIGTYRAMEDARSASLDNNAKALQNSYLQDSLMARNNLAWQKFYWSGGIPSTFDSVTIGQALRDRLVGQSDYTRASVNNMNLRSDYINDLMKTSNVNRMLSGAQLKNLNNQIFEYEQTQKEWTKMLGKWKGPLNGLMNIFSGGLGSFFKAFGGASGFNAAR